MMVKINYGLIKEFIHFNNLPITLFPLVYLLYLYTIYHLDIFTYQVFSFVFRYQFF